jgi:hypothetical protein
LYRFFINIAVPATLKKPRLIGRQFCPRGAAPCCCCSVPPFGRIVSQIGAGETIEELLVDYPYIKREDIMQALQFAAWLAQGHTAALVEKRKWCQSPFGRRGAPN